MSKFSDYLASQITPQMTLLEKFNLMIKFLQENNYISVFYSQEKYNIQTQSYQKEKVNLNGFTLHIGDCIVFSNGYYAFVETIGVNTFTIGNILYFQGQQGVSVVGATISSGHLILTLSDGTNIDAGNLKGITNFSIDGSQHLIVNYQDGTSQDLGAIFNGNISISGNLSVSGTISGNLSGNVTGGNITGDNILENMTGYSFTKRENTSTLFRTYVYCSASKTGNKLTLVYFMSFKITAEQAGNNIQLGTFIIPKAVGNKIYPYTLDGISNVIANNKISIAKNYNTFEDLPMLMFKTVGTSQDAINANLYNVNSLDLDTDYLVRIEHTFLLSDNMVE